MLVHLLIVSAIVLVSGSFGIYYIESMTVNSEINSMLDAIWWTAATVTTVGYGDVVPVTELGRIIGIIYMFAGISILGIFISTLGASLMSSKLIHGRKHPTIENQVQIIQKIDDLRKIVEMQGKTLEELKKTKV